MPLPCPRSTLVSGSGKRGLLGGKIGIYDMDESTAVEIDEPEDWALVERLLLQRRGK